MFIIQPANLSYWQSLRLAGFISETGKVTAMKSKGSWRGAGLVNPAPRFYHPIGLGASHHTFRRIHDRRNKGGIHYRG
jgi:hypothetical protein